MPAAYTPRTLEAAAQAHWQAHDAYRVREHALDAQGAPKPKYYACSMLPYPSGKLHMGHVRNYTINDMLARQLRMRGYNVLMPMGWDAFGLPAENAAIKNRVPPAQWTYDNIAYMKRQMQALGLAIDWSREVTTCAPDYYRWNQWLFLRMLERGIAYRKTQVVNWDPVDQTVLANEQVIDGRGWRTGALVEKREIPGYYLNITAYAPELLEQVQSHLSGWPDKVRLMQENWIGKSEGLRFAFTHTIAGADGALIQGGRLYVFTTRADTLMGVTFCAVAPEHPLALHAAARNPALAAFLEQCRHGGATEAELATQDKLGMDSGLRVTHPLSGASLPLWVGNYVLMSYGDGAVMGVPAHDERDFAFALKYGLPIRQVVGWPGSGATDAKEGLVSMTLGSAAPPSSLHVSGGDAPAPNAATPAEAGAPLGRAPGEESEPATDEPGARPGGATGAPDHSAPASAPPAFDPTRWQDWYADKSGALVCIHSGVLDGLPYRAAVDKVAQLLAERGLGEKKTTWRLRDWGISRQRYWGTPIPIIHCPEHGPVPVPEADLPVRLPEDCVPDGSGNPLVKHAGFHAGVTCPICGAPARRETDTMDTFVDSSWYYMRYCDPHDAQAMVGSGTRYWMPMDQYIGGVEHAILHLLYARFWTKVMRDLGLVQIDEPFTRLLTQGMVLNHIYSRRSARGGKDYFWPKDVEPVFDASGKQTGARLKQATASSDGELPAGTAIDYEGVGTMSKSKNNGVDPQELIEQYGADTARLYTMFTAPPEATLEWNDAAVEGSFRFLKRVWALGQQFGQADWSASAALAHAQPSLGVAATSAAAQALRREVHLLLKQIDYDYQRLQYNTVVSGCMKLLNTLEAALSAYLAADADAGVDPALGLALIEGLGILLRCLYPAAPHLTHTLWSTLGYDSELGDLLDAPWPQVDAQALQQDEIELVLQVNGKLRGSVRVAAQAQRAEVEAAALAHAAVLKQTQGGPPKKVVWVPGRLVNVVV